MPSQKAVHDGLGYAATATAATIARLTADLLYNGFLDY